MEELLKNGVDLFDELSSLLSTMYAKNKGRA
jgi:hypothetical protein